MDPEFWHRRWKLGEIGFHESRANELLVRHWPSLGVPAGARVLVPLCGKSLDMAWLAGRGHRVLGVELSAIAVRDFFRENALLPEVGEHDGFQTFAAGGIEIWCGDVFGLTTAHLADVAAVYDRAALVALPPDLRVAYAGWLARVVPGTAPILLVTLDYDQTQTAGPPFAVAPAGVRELLARDFAITEVERRDALAASPGMQKRGVTRLDEYALRLDRRKS